MSKLNQIVLEQGETKIDTWDLYYILPSGEKYLGSFMVTTRRLFFDAKSEGSALGFIEATSPFAPNSLGIYEISKARIRSVELEKSFLSKKAVITLDNGEVHKFDRGALSADKVIDAIKQT
jgi:hypothetical protein